MPVAEKDCSKARVQSARRTLSGERFGLEELDKALDGELGEAFVSAVEIIHGAKGRVILSGVGKSGHIARKIAATMASTGTPASFVHATEASHGDLGMVTTDDVIVVLSNSGETHELKDLLGYSRRKKVPLIAITANRRSTLGNAADVTLSMPGAPEACPRGLAPTTSTTMQLAIGDALAITLLEENDFTASDFHHFHPGGRLGAALLRVEDIMHRDEKMPLVSLAEKMSDVLIVMSQKSFGCAGVCDQNGQLVGIITDGDLRRHMNGDLISKKASDIMSPNPRSVAPDTTASTALEMLNSGAITSMFVVENEKPTGIIHIHDLLHVGAI